MPRKPSKKRALKKRSRSRNKRPQGLSVEALEQRTVLSGTPINFDLNPLGGSSPEEFVQIGEVTYFVASVNDSTGRELWKTDGTKAGTELVADIRPGAGSSFPSSLVNLNGTLYFAADDGEHGLELWQSDGTAQGTVMVRDLNPGLGTDNAPNSSSPQNLMNVDGVLYFTANDGVSGVELWASDGTSQGTRLVRDIFSGVGNDGTTPLSSLPSDFTIVDGTLFFTAVDGEAGRELWKTTDTAVGATRVKDIFPGVYDDTTVPHSSAPTNLVNVDGTLFFTAYNLDHGNELWKSDGTQAGTVLVKDLFEGTYPYSDSEDNYIGPRPNNSSPGLLTAFDGELYFVAANADNGAELWKSDGTDAGTVMVTEIVAGSEGAFTNVDTMLATDTTLFFTANDGVNGNELWSSDGTAQGTQLLRDIVPGDNPNGDPDSSDGLLLKTIGDTLYFSAFTSRTGRELWKSDGTTSGTVMVEDLSKGVRGTYPLDIVEVNGHLLFTATEPGSTAQTRELWGLAEEDDFTLTIMVDSQFVDIPMNLGVDAQGGTADFYTVTDTGQVLFTPDAGAMLGDFFDTWRTDARLAGNNPDAELSGTSLLGNMVDFDNTLQMFVNGQVVDDFEDYVVQDDDDVVLAFGSNPVISVNTNFGSIVVELFTEQTPITVENFLNYVNDGDYLNSIFHRSVNPSVGQSITVIQGGGFRTNNPIFEDAAQLLQIPTDPAIQNEPGISNTRGTIAMAKIGGDPNSATSGFFFNVSDANSVLDNNNGGFTVFGQALGMTTVDKIASLPISQTPPAPFNNLPISPGLEMTVVEEVVGYGDMTGTVYFDANNDGNQDNGEGGLESIVIYSDANGNGQRDDGERFTTTDAQGRYRLQVMPGEQTVRADFSAGGFVTSGETQVATAEIGREVGDLDFGALNLVAPTSIDLADASDTGADNQDNLTLLNNTSATTALSFEVTGVTAGAEVHLYAGTQLIGTAVAQGETVVVTTDGSTTLADGVHQITATQVISGLESDPSGELSVTIDVTAPGDFTTPPPSFFNDPSVFAQVGQPFTYDVDSPDEGGEDVVYSLFGAPSTMTIDPATGQIAWTPEASDAQPQDFEVRLTDAAGNTIAQQASLTVLNDAPARPDRYEIDEDTPLAVSSTAGVLVNDGDADSVVTSAAVVDGPLHGQLEFNPNNGAFIYTPDPDFFGEDSFTYTASTDTEQSNVARVTIVVNAVEDEPEPTADTYDATEDTTLSVPAATGVLANDTDADGDPLTATIDQNASNGVVVMMDDGSFSYTPNDNFNGQDSFTYTVTDGKSTSDPVTVTLNVAAVNDPPEVMEDGYTVDEDGSLTVTVNNGVLSNDTDVDSDLTATLASDASNGTLDLQADGSFSYTPDADFFGTDTFTYTATDGDNTSAEVTVTITVTAQPDDPNAVDDAFDVLNDGSTQTLGVLANDNSDPDGSQALTITNVTQGDQGGTIAIDGSTITYTGVVGFIGTETFTYTIQDTDGLTSTATVTLNVVEAAGNSLSGTVYVDLDGDNTQDASEVGVPGVVITLHGTDGTGASVMRSTTTDADGGYAFTDLPAGTYSVTQSQPAALEEGDASSDDQDATVGVNLIENIVLSGGEEHTGNNFSELSVKVQYQTIAWMFASSANQPAYFLTVIESAGQSAPAASGTISQSLAAADLDFETQPDTPLDIIPGEGLLTDAVGGQVTAELVEGARHGDLSVDADGAFFYTPNTDFIGEDFFTFRVTDGTEYSETATASIGVGRIEAFAEMANEASDDSATEDSTAEEPIDEQAMDEALEGIERWSLFHMTAGAAE